MDMNNSDSELIEIACSPSFHSLLENEIKELKEEGIFEKNAFLEYPFDEATLKKLKQIVITDSNDDYAIFNYITLIKEIWKILIEKSIKCLRFFDNREPFSKNTTKKPIAYGINDLSIFFDKYAEFESILYGTNNYRDHVIHVFRTCLLGVKNLIKNDGEYLNRIKIGENIDINKLEKLSIWTIISLTHDLGYPLEKAQGIISKTKEMMYSFVANPNISLDLSYSGVQNNMNDFVLRFISSKMEKTKVVKDEEKPYEARLQPKYYFKFQKSLEESKHGIISCIILYKLLIYFLESDFNINEDYGYNEDERKQFYIRREILRSIASHTCFDVYHLNIFSFPFLLIIADDCQEWGRKRINELYVRSNVSYELENINIEIDEANFEHKCKIFENFSIKNLNTLVNVFMNLLIQCDNYRTIYRDGQYTNTRNFSIYKRCELRYPKTKFVVTFSMIKDRSATFRIEINKSGDRAIDAEAEEVISELFCRVKEYKQYHKDTNELHLKYKEANGDSIVYTIPDDFNE